MREILEEYGGIVFVFILGIGYILGLSAVLSGILDPEVLLNMY